MNAAQTKAAPALFWNEQGAICCERHSPYPKSDTWINERWMRIPSNAYAEIAKSFGRPAKCECCQVQEKTNGAPPNSSSVRSRR